MDEKLQIIESSENSSNANLGQVEIVQKQSGLKTQVKNNGNNSKIQSQIMRDARMNQLFMNPLMAKLEEAVAKNMKSLDEIEEKINKENYDAQMARLTSHIPNEIKGNGHAIEKILANLDKLLSALNETTDNNKAADQNAKTVQLKDSFEKVADCPKTSPLDQLNEIICLASSINTYLRTINTRFFQNENINIIPNEIYANVNLWLSRLFRFHTTNTLFHKHDYESIVFMSKLIMRIKYKNLNTDGFKAFADREPVFYVSASSKYAQVEYRQKICSVLCLPLDSIRIIKTIDQFGPLYDKLDTHNLIEQIEKDIREKKLPQLVVANAGSLNVGQCDDFLEIERICTHYKIWLHLDGVHLSTLVLYSVPTVLQPVNSGDSITLDFGNWIGVSSLASVTLYKEIEGAHKIIESVQNSWDCLDQSLPYWCLLQAIGHEGIVERIKHSTDFSKHVVETVKRQQPFLKLITFKEDPDEKEITSKNYTVSEIIAKTISFITLVELNNSVVIFKCNDVYIQDTLYKHNLELRKDETKDKAFFDEYCDILTSWLCELLNSVHKSVHLDIVNVKEEGLCIRYSPVEHANLLHTRDEDLSQFLKSFEEFLQILDASIKCKAMFETNVAKYPNLKPISIQKWAGVGAVRYITDSLLQKLDNQDEKFVFETNKMNSELVKSLQFQDGAYSLAQTDDGLLLGVKFGMVNNVDALEKLIIQVQRTGKSIEESEKFIETVEGLVRQGIKKANEDLKKENEKKLYEEGLLRQLPVVSGLINWFAPRENISITGRAFNIKSGKIETTESIYKYHMQIEENNDVIKNDKLVDKLSETNLISFDDDEKSNEK